MPLSLVNTEAGLPTVDDRFSADIHAINDSDDSTVLIENQLTTSDHIHLGQILTYLAGLEAKTIIWVAPKFRDAHLAAIRWFNEHTDEQFSFFAVRLRVVKIGSSPLAPLFDVLEQPNDWQRRTARSARTAESTADWNALKTAFWASLSQKYPERSDDFGGGMGSNRWIRFGEELVIGYYVAKESVGVYIRGRRGVSAEAIATFLGPHSVQLGEQLGVPMGQGGEWYYYSRFAGDYKNPEDAAKMVEWLGITIPIYISALEKSFPNKGNMP